MLCSILFQFKYKIYLQFVQFTKSGSIAHGRMATARHREDEERQTLKSYCEMHLAARSNLI
jgi:hypothetical protein